MLKQDSPNSNSIGYRIRELRQKKGLSQKELGDLLGCAQNTVAEWENRKGRAPGKNILPKVAKVLEVSVEYLLGVEKVERPRIPCYGEFCSKEFEWPQAGEVRYQIEVPEQDYTSDRFAIEILDNLLKPIINKGDYGIFQPLPPENGDIVAVRLPENKGKIAMWREQGNAVMLVETNLEAIDLPYFFTYRTKENLNYIIKPNSKNQVIVEGKLVAVRKNLKSVKGYSKISYIIF